MFNKSQKIALCILDKQKERGKLIVNINFNIFNNYLERFMINYSKGGNHNGS